MQFRLDEDQQQLQQGIARILSPDRTRSRVRAVLDGKSSWDEETWRELIDFGVTALIVPVENEGMGLSMIELALVAEEIGRTGVAVPFLGHALATVALIHGGSEDQKARLLPKLASGEWLGSVAISDHNGTWAPESWTLLPSSGKISGRKINIPNGDRADVLIVGLAGGTLGIVEPAAGGVTFEAVEGLDLMRPLVAAEFDNANVELLGDGAAGAERMWTAALALLSADAFGGSWRLLEMTRDYVQVREAFGAKLAEFQAIKHQLANLVLEVEPTRGLYWFAAYSFVHLPDKSAHAASLAKAQTSEVFLQTARLCTELLGGIGFTWEYDSHVWLKRAMFDFAWAGSPQLLFVRAAALAGW